MRQFYINVARLMGILPRPRFKQKDPFEKDKAETLKELGILMEGYTVC